MLGQLFDDGLGVVGERVGARGMQGDGGVDARIGVGSLGDPTRGCEVVSDRHNRLHAHRLGPVDDLVDAGGIGRAARVEMGVRVDEGYERLRGRGFSRLAERLSLTATQ